VGERDSVAARATSLRAFAENRTACAETEHYSISQDQKAATKIKVLIMWQKYLYYKNA
jgi:hypothetical protein